MNSTTSLLTWSISGRRTDLKAGAKPRTRRLKPMSRLRARRTTGRKAAIGLTSTESLPRASSRRSRQALQRQRGIRKQKRRQLQNRRQNLSSTRRSLTQNWGLTERKQTSSPGSMLRRKPVHWPIERPLVRHSKKPQRRRGNLPGSHQILLKGGSIASSRSPINRWRKEDRNLRRPSSLRKSILS